MSDDSYEFKRALCWLILAGLSELLSLLLIIWGCFEYEISLIANNPLYTSFTIAAIGFGLSLCCTLVSLTKPKRKQSRTKKRSSY
jgi:protein-S-isoprenylcysteine O-methyltransferase Ste14